MASGSRIARLAALLTGEMGQHPTRVKAFLDSLDPAAASRLIAAADAGDTRTIRKAMAEQTWGTAPARPAPRVEVTPGGRDPMSFRDRIARDPNPRRSLEEAGVATGDMSNPEVLKAYVRSVRADAPPRGRPRSAEDSIRELVQEPQEAIAEQFEQAVGLTPQRAVDVPTRQTELPFGPETLSPAEREAYQYLADGRSVVRRGEVPEDEYAALVTEDLRRQPFIRQDEPLTTVADDLAFDEVPPRVGRPRTTPTDDAARRAAYAAAAAGAAGGAYLLSGGDDGDLTGSGNPAELQDEDPLSGSALAFSDEVLGGMSEDDLTSAVAQPAAATNDYGVEYLKLMRRLNQMNRTGAPTPDELAMQAEVRRLGDLTTRQRREGGYSFPANHPAARIRNEAMRFPIGSPERDRLNAQADAIENAVVTGRMPWDFESAAADPFADLDGPVAAPTPAARPSASLTETGNPADLEPTPLSPAESTVATAVEEAIRPPRPTPVQEAPMPARAASKPRRRPSEYPDQAAANDAAATRIAPDSDLGGYAGGVREEYRERLIAAGYTPEQANAIIAFESTQQGGLRPQDVSDEALREKAARTAARWRRTDAQKDAYFEATGGNYEGPAAPRSTVTVDGVTVPSAVGALGQPLGDGQYFRLGDVRRAQEAEREARRVAQLDAATRKEHDQFGTLHPDATALVRHATDAQGRPLYRTADDKITTDRFRGEPIMEPTPSQDLHGYGMEYGRDHKPATQFDTPNSIEQVERWRDNAMARRGIEERTRQSPGYARAQARRFAESTGLPVAEVDAILATPGGRARLDAMAQDKSIERDRVARDRVAARAFLAGGSQNINSGNSAMINALVALEGVNPDDMTAQQQALMQNLPIDPYRAQVEGRRWDMAGRLAGDVVTGALAGQGASGVGADARARKNADDSAAWFEQWHADRIPSAIDGPYTQDQHDWAIRYMMSRFRVDRATAEAIAQSRGLPRVAPSSPPAWSPAPGPGMPSSQNPPPGPPPMPRSMPM